MMSQGEILDPKTLLAYKRTQLALDRTLMGWIRTSISMIGFGFTIYKFFQYLKESHLLQGSWQPHGPWNLGIFLISLGTVTLVAALVEYRFSLTELADAAHQHYQGRTIMITAILIVLVGLVLLINLLFRIGPV